MHNVTQNMRHICIHMSEQQQLKNHMNQFKNLDLLNL